MLARPHARLARPELRGRTLVRASGLGGTIRLKAAGAVYSRACAARRVRAEVRASGLGGTIRLKAAGAVYSRACAVAECVQKFASQVDMAAAEVSCWDHDGPGSNRSMCKLHLRQCV